MDWATSQNNLGLSLRWLATVTRNAALMDEAAAAYAACLTRHTRDDAPFPWAQTQWNLADLALARHALAPTPRIWPPRKPTSIWRERCLRRKATTTSLPNVPGFRP